MKDTEIEIQGQIERSDKLLKLLKEKAQFISEKRQIDEYFTPAHRNFVGVRPIKEWLRLRSEGDAFSLNYKNWHYDKKGIGQYADEYETPIENIDTTRKILKAINVKPLIKVDKTRRKWMYEDYEIAMDSVKNLGDFIEVEYKGKKTSGHKKIRQEMIDFLKKLDCGKIILNNGGYPFQLLFPKETHRIEVK